MTDTERMYVLVWGIRDLPFTDEVESAISHARVTHVACDGRVRHDGMLVLVRVDDGDRPYEREKEAGFATEYLLAVDYPTGAKRAAFSTLRQIVGHYGFEAELTDARTHPTLRYVGPSYRVAALHAWRRFDACRRPTQVGAAS